MASSSAEHSDDLKGMQLEFGSTVDSSKVILVSKVVLTWKEWEVPLYVWEVGRKLSDNHDEQHSFDIDIYLDVAPRQAQTENQHNRFHQAAFHQVLVKNVRCANQTCFFLDLRCLCEYLHAEEFYGVLVSILSHFLDVFPWGRIKDHLEHVMHHLPELELRVTPDVEQGLRTALALMTREETYDNMGDFCHQQLIYVALNFIQVYFFLNHCQYTEKVMWLSRAFFRYLPPAMRESSTIMSSALQSWRNGETASRREFFSKLTILLIRSGADINVRDIFGNTPLHDVASARRHDDDAVAIAECLLKTGVHLDLENIGGDTPLKCATKGKVKDLIKSYYPLPLSCLAAGIIRQYNIPCSPLPELLRRFVDIHKYTLPVVTCDP